MQINSKNVRGEAGTGFEKRGNRGPFECGNCRSFHKGHCEQEDMVKVSSLPRTKDDFPIVAAEDCCDYITRLTKVF